jgi:cellulose synthase/poly-beta-1,6-N-acetylglucosamine synthase-like glycosyltransferase
MILLNFTAILLLAYLGWAVLFQLLPAVAGLFFQKEKGRTDGRFRRFAVLIPAYKEDNVIVDTVKAALRQNYPAELYEVVPIADQLSDSTLQKIWALGVQPFVVDFKKSTKAKSLNAAMAQLGTGFDAVVVLDADNHPERDFLLKMNEAMGKGLQAVQGCRVAKNHNNSMAMLDGVSEAVNNHLLCSGQRALGLSARLAGSGMAFDFDLFKKVMKNINALGGFDKELELRLTQMKVKIGYATEAKVLDEKVDNTGTFSRQRGRWLAAQYRYGRRFAMPALKGLLFYGNIDFFNKTLQMALPPRLLMPGVLLTGAVVSTLFQSGYAPIWQTLLVGNFLAFALAIPRSYWSMDFLRALLDLPKAFLAMLKALTIIPLATKSFLHTPHGTIASA